MPIFNSAKGRKDALKKLAMCERALGTMAESHVALGCGNPDAVPAGAFEVDVNRRLHAPTPVRAVEVMSFAEAVAYFQAYARDLAHVLGAPAQPSLRHLLAFVWHTATEVRPCVAVRSRLLLLCVGGRKVFHTTPIIDYIADSGTLMVVAVFVLID